MLEPKKLSELRVKTDRQLSAIVLADMESGLTLARVAEAHYSLGDYDQGEWAYQRARAKYIQTKAVLPLVRTLAPRERARCEQTLAHLRRTLDALARVSLLRRPACA